MGTSDGSMIVGLANRVVNTSLRRAWTGQFAVKPCSHTGLIQNVVPSADVCLGCLATGDTWPSLRICLTCGYVGCCDSSKNKHARAHFQQTGHPLISPYNVRGMDWVWCSLDETLLDP
jgi:uncharacterized UBP type Zn finger protein